MNLEILDQITFEINFESLSRKLRIKNGSRYVKELEKLAAEAKSIARPKALYKTAFIESNQQQKVQIDNQVFESRILAEKLENSRRVFIYLATCGRELEEWAASQNDMLYRYWADTLNEMALKKAYQTLSAHLTQKYHLKKYATMSPGRLEDWPITNQKPLFELFETNNQKIGVELTESFLMTPVKTISGICFPTETVFESCQLCPREKCPDRKVAFDEKLYQAQYN